MTTSAVVLLGDALDCLGALQAKPAVVLPHAAGGRPIGAAERIAENLAALLENRPLRDVVVAE